ncbi:MAG: hypothetical protein HDS15_02300 [Bacteroides sp.]|nr:hypothetical protein [Bacteroides sp.]
MSKTQLKKLLTHLDQEQMTQLILELYDARPEAKDYLDFYAQPDIDTRIEKAKKLIDKEARRRQRGFPRPRVTKIKRYIRDISSLNPGDEFTLEIMTYAFEELCRQAEYPYKEATQKGCARLLTDTITQADRSGMLGEYLDRAGKAIEGLPKMCGPFSQNRMRKMLKQTLEDAIASLGA